MREYQRVVARFTLPLAESLHPKYSGSRSLSTPAQTPQNCSIFLPPPRLLYQHKKRKLFKKTYHQTTVIMNQELKVGKMHVKQRSIPRQLQQNAESSQLCLRSFEQYKAQACSKQVGRSLKNGPRTREVSSNPLGPGYQTKNIYFTKGKKHSQHCPQQNKQNISSVAKYLRKKGKCGLKRSVQRQCSDFWRGCSNFSDLEKFSLKSWRISEDDLELDLFQS